MLRPPSSTSLGHRPGTSRNPGYSTADATALARSTLRPGARSRIRIPAASPASPAMSRIATPRAACSFVAWTTSTRYRPRNPVSMSSSRSLTWIRTSQRTTPAWRRAPAARRAAAVPPRWPGSRRPGFPAAGGGVSAGPRGGDPPSTPRRGASSASNAGPPRATASQATAAHSASARYADRQPPPAASTATSRTGPATEPTDPASSQRAMCCSRRAGSASISPDWVRLTKAPEAGKKSTNATSRPASERAVAAATSARMNTTPPPSTARRRRRPCPARIPRGSSSRLPSSSGSDASRPTCP